VSLIERYREDMDNFMVSKGSNETINKDTKNFLEAYFEYKWAIHRKDKYKELRCVISNLFLQDLKNLKYHKSSQLRLYNVFLQACKVAKDSKGKKYDCNKQGSIKQFFEDHIKFDTALSGNYVSLIEDYRDDMKSFMAPNGTNESIRKDTKTFLEAYFQYKWFIQDKDEYTELRDAISVLYSKDFNNLKHNKTSEIRLYNAFLQACKNAKDPKDKKYDCNEQGSIKQFFEDHIKFKK
jgi:mRNA-degrading endonuclease YafQ of YafQ-DinJ toxin-antitoxin module